MMSGSSQPYNQSLVSVFQVPPHSQMKVQSQLDIATSGFWGGRQECAFFDVQIFNPHAPSNR